MQQNWSVYRRDLPQPDGQRRWDLAYQCLLKWAQAMNQQETSQIRDQQEAHDESSHLRTRIHLATGTSPRYRATDQDAI